MYDTKLQVPIDSKVLVTSKKQAQSLGFSSVNEVVRIFLQKFSQGEVGVSFQNLISQDRKEELDLMIEEMRKESREGKAIRYKDSKSLMETLNG